MSISIAVRDLFTLEDYDSIIENFDSVEKRGSYLIGQGYTDKEIGLFLNKRVQHINHIRNRSVALELHEVRLAKYRKSQKTS